MVKRLVVGAHFGMRTWLIQRVTAVIMVIYTLAIVLALLAQRPAGHDGWKAFANQGWFRFTSFLFILALAYHAWIGVRDIFMDYIKPTGVRLTMHVVVIVLLVGYVGWALQVLWRL